MGAGIINCTELCLDTKITPDQQEYLGLVKFSAEHLLNVINDILVSAKSCLVCRPGAFFP
jgi:signal transduction histidine kinase